MAKAKMEGRKKRQGVYYEAHHIIPKCMGGEGACKEFMTHPNVVLLTAREHFLCHLILAVLNRKNRKLQYAFMSMLMESKYHERNLSAKGVNGRLFSELRESAAKMHGDLLRGRKMKPMSEEQKKKLSISRVGKSVKNFNTKFTEECKKRIGYKSGERLLSLGNNHWAKSESYKAWFKNNNPMYKPGNEGMFKDGKNPNAKKVKIVESGLEFNSIKECRQFIGKSLDFVYAEIKRGNIIKI